jgi:hypothetical protein
VPRDHRDRVLLLRRLSHALFVLSQLMQFLQEHGPPVASEVRQAYIETMGKIVLVRRAVPRSHVGN